MSTKNTETSKNDPKPIVSKQALDSITDEETSNRIPLKRLCAEADIEPKTARRKLRKAKFDWHTMKERWVFEPDSDELKQARIVLGLDKADS